MRIVSHGIVYFKDPESIKSLKNLMLNWSSCKRAAYQAIHKHKLTGNDVKVYCKKNYMGHLNQRYVADAVSEASKIEHEHSLFGGKKLWDKFMSGSISKMKWQQVRNNTLYSRGDKSLSGNPNIRVVDKELWINDPSERGRWIKGNLWINKHIDFTCYEIRIQLKNEKFHVIISWEDKNEVLVTTNKSKGVIGIDTNPNGVALSELNSIGNLQSHVFMNNNRIQFAQTGKRDYDIKQIAIKAVAIARGANKPLVLEQLTFKNGKKSKKFNRMAHNFIYRRLINAVKVRAYKEGVEIIEVPAAYTSIVGKLKYMDMYSLSVHNSAAMVIGRLGFLNRSDKVVVDVSNRSGLLKLEARGRTVSLKKKSFLWFKSKFRICQKPPGLTAPCLAPG
jgi:IS605 OrfB family transposase